MLLRLLRVALSTAVQRVRRGPLRPTWSLGFEATVAFLRDTAQRAATLSPQGERALWATLRPPPSPVLARVRRTEVDAGGVSGQWFDPPHVDGDTVVLYLHGGAFIFGSLTSHGELIARLATESGSRVLGLRYRLAPEDPFPAALDDTMAAYRWLLDTGVAASRIVFAGDSAGGNLALTAMLRARSLGLPLPAGGIALCPWVDLTPTGGTLDTHARFDWGVTAAFPAWAATYAPGHDLRDPLVSPHFGDLVGLPPLLVMGGEVEMLRDQIDAFVARAREAGVAVTHAVFPDMVHNWVTLHAFTPEARRGYTQMADFLRALRRS